MVASSSVGCTGFSSGAEAVASDLPKTKPRLIPPPAIQQVKQYGQWSRPSLLLALPDVLTPRCGLRPNSPTATTSVSLNRPRSSRSAIRAARAGSNIGADWFFMRFDRSVCTSQEWLSELATLGQFRSEEHTSEL